MRKRSKDARSAISWAALVVGSNYAVLERGPLRMSGFFRFLVWAFVHILSLPQLQNRLRMQRQWLWLYLTGQRSSRLIPEQSRTRALKGLSRNAPKKISCVLQRQPNRKRKVQCQTDPLNV